LEVGSGTLYLVGTKLMQVWLTTSGISFGLIVLLSSADFPDTLKKV
jgi:PAT family beta-lactamase induction signal transducer AmpG